MHNIISFQLENNILQRIYKKLIFVMDIKRLKLKTLKISNCINFQDCKTDLFNNANIISC